jgi:hypothetical protein
MIYAEPSTTFVASAGQAPTGLVGTIGVRIENADGSTHTARTTAGIVELEAGSGIYAKSDLVAPDSEGTYFVLWDTGGGSPAFAEDRLEVTYDAPVPSPPGPDGYPTREELVDGSTVPELAALTEPQQDALRAAAITAVEQFTGQSFVPDGTVGSPVTHQVDGDGRDELWLPKRLETLVSLTVKGNDLDASDIDISEDRNRISLNPDAIMGTWATRALREDRRPTFPSGLNTVAITGAWGWEETPEGVVDALRIDMEDAALASAASLGGTIRAFRKLGVKAIDQGGLRVDLSGAALALSSEAMAKLEDYVWHPKGVVA